ncbi:MAG: radical SAM/Cys-rich domain protein [Gammaproteobacteria bacterium]|nr:radical SAM/Cys-rich domain protein [Gammaproteobacteria bacterium]
MHATLPLLEETDFPVIRRAQLDTLQVNLGYRCNQQCLHCHVNAGPKRTEMMARQTAEQLVDLMKTASITTLDLTGGAPEMNENFRYLVTHARNLGIRVIDRCNLTILEEPGQESLAQFLAEQQVEVSASLPCYIEDNVDKQRGNGVFAASIRGLRNLNSLGYGDPASGLVLNLVYNPQGPSLPPPQESLEAAYRKHLQEEYNICFNHLFTLTNMPIKRFGSMLISKGQFDGYMQLLRDAYQADNLKNLMCRTQLSIDWQGYIYDCDFNQMLELPSVIGGRPRSHIQSVKNSALEGLPIVVKDHCYGCSAGQGSSCGGSLN